MKIIVASTSLLARPLASALKHNQNHELVGIVTRQDKAFGRGLSVTSNPLAVWAKEEKIEVFKPKNMDDFELLIRSSKVDLIITISYGQIITPSLLSLPKFGWLNVHFSVLPKFRGAAPVQRAILSGDKTTGVSVFKLDQGLDTGAVYKVLEVPLKVDATTEDVLIELSELGADIAVETLSMISNGVLPTPQSEVGVSYAAKFNKADGQIFWDSPSEQIYNLYRALHHNPGVWTMLGELRLKIEKLRPTIVDKTLKCGEVFIDAEKLIVGTANGAIEILNLTPAGRVSMTASEFIRGLSTRTDLHLG
ncbi:MAG: methionyl-tRNA formyltransferase [Candidatus Nanopelagicus sp.]